MWNPATPDGRTQSKLGELREHGKHGQDGKHQKDELKQTLYSKFQSLYFMAFMGHNIATAEKIMIYALEENDPGSAHDWRTTREFVEAAFWSPSWSKIQSLVAIFLTALPTAENAEKFVTAKMSMMTISNDYNPADVTLLIDDTPNGDNFKQL